MDGWAGAVVHKMLTLDTYTSKNDLEMLKYYQTINNASDRRTDGQTDGRHYEEERKNKKTKERKEKGKYYL